MVSVKVYFEGGVDPQTNRDASASGGAIMLRQSLNKLFNAYFDGQAVEIDARPIGSFTNVIKVREQDCYLMIDLDGPSATRTKRIQELQLSDIPDHVFFMVQAMEAWILSQPKAIEKTFAHIKTSTTAIEVEESLQVHNPEEIHRPAFELKVILGRHFEYSLGGKKKKLKYGKLMEGSLLLEALDIHGLKDTFSDVKSLLERVAAKGS